MKINRLKLENFRLFDRAELQLDGKSTVIFGVNGTGKTSVLTSINLLYANIIKNLINDIYRLINRKSFDEAERKVKELEKITDSVNKDVLRANILIKKGRLS